MIRSLTTTITIFFSFTDIRGLLDISLEAFLLKEIVVKEHTSSPVSIASMAFPSFLPSTIGVFFWFVMSLPD